MKNAKVVLGGYYVANVSGDRATVQVVREHECGGWVGLNVRTGREIRIKSGRRLLCVARTLPGECFPGAGK